MIRAGNLPSFLDEFTTLLDVPTEGIESFASDSVPIFEYNDSKTALLPESIYHALLRSIADDPSIHHGTTYRSVYKEVAQTKEVLLSAAAHSTASIKHRGKRFCTISYCEDDSRVVYRKGEHLILGQIVSIFGHKRGCQDGKFHEQVFVALRRYQSLTQDDALHDPYRRMQGLRTTLTYSTPTETVVVVPMSNITSHFVACPFQDKDSVLSRPCIVALPLDQVSSWHPDHNNMNL